jgi:hypothetical protein
MGWGRGSQVKGCDGSKNVSKRARALFDGSRQRPEADAGAEEKRVYVVTLLVLGLGVGGLDGVSFDNNLSKPDTVLSVAAVGG